MGRSSVPERSTSASVAEIDMQSQGWLTKPTEKKRDSSDVYQSVRQRLVDEMKAESIRLFLRSFTKLPHLAGTEQNFLLAKQIQSQWKEFGLDSAELVHYDVLLSYPSETQPNYISVIDDQGNEVIFLMIKLYLCKISFKKRCLPLSSHSLFRALGLIILKKLKIKKS